MFWENDELFADEVADHMSASSVDIPLAYEVLVAMEGEEERSVSNDPHFSPEGPKGNTGIQSTNWHNIDGYIARAIRQRVSRNKTIRCSCGSERLFRRRALKNQFAI